MLAHVFTIAMSAICAIINVRVVALLKENAPTRISLIVKCLLTALLTQVFLVGYFMNEQSMAFALVVVCCLESLRLRNAKQILMPVTGMALGLGILATIAKPFWTSGPTLVLMTIIAFQAFFSVYVRIYMLGTAWFMVLTQMAILFLTRKRPNAIENRAQLQTATTSMLRNTLYESYGYVSLIYLAVAVGLKFLSLNHW